MSSHGRRYHKPKNCPTKHSKNKPYKKLRREKNPVSIFSLMMWWFWQIFWFWIESHVNIQKVNVNSVTVEILRYSYCILLHIILILLGIFDKEFNISWLCCMLIFLLYIFSFLIFQILRKNMFGICFSPPMINGVIMRGKHTNFKDWMM